MKESEGKRRREIERNEFLYFWVGGVSCEVQLLRCSTLGFLIKFKHVTLIVLIPLKYTYIKKLFQWG